MVLFYSEIIELLNFLIWISTFINPSNFSFSSIKFPGRGVRSNCISESLDYLMFPHRDICCSLIHPGHFLQFPLIFGIFVKMVIIKRLNVYTIFVMYIFHFLKIICQCLLPVPLPLGFYFLHEPIETPFTFTDDLIIKYSWYVPFQLYGTQMFQHVCLVLCQFSPMNNCFKFNILIF